MNSVGCGGSERDSRVTPKKESAASSPGVSISANSNDSNPDYDRDLFFETLHAFRSYRGHFQSIILKRLNYVESLPSHYQATLENYKFTLLKLVNCIEKNHRVLERITEEDRAIFGNSLRRRNFTAVSPKITEANMEHVQSTLKLIYRDWSRDGLIERIQCYQPILDELQEHFLANTPWRRRENVHVLVPGAGLGRLAFEIAKLGFSCQGSEYSLYLLTVSNFIINKCSGKDLFTIYPWTATVDNNLTSRDMVHPVMFPDTNTYTMVTSSDKPRLTMAAGDFLEIYSDPNDWDYIVTCFFIDCASNIYAYIERIHRILKKGGLWITLGPLQYYFSRINDKMSIEPSFEDVKMIVRSVGFEILRENARVPTLYCQNRSSMLKQHYDSVFLSCRKI